MTLRSPWTYLTAISSGAYAETADWPVRAYAGPRLAVAGGSIPIATARTLPGKTVTIEGIATMYTDAFYAGSTGTKFYLEDESGGIQVYCPGGLGLVMRRWATGCGSPAKSRSIAIRWRSSPAPIQTTWKSWSRPRGGRLASHADHHPAANSDDTMLGRLNQVEGTVTRIEEFSYSYEVDLTDDTGYTALLYIEKETGISIEPLEIGQSYRVAGISEMYDENPQVKPRTAGRFGRGLSARADGRMRRPTASRRRAVHLYCDPLNHTPETLTNVRVVATRPSGDVS